MCGITVSLTLQNPQDASNNCLNDDLETLKRVNVARGPDSNSERSVQVCKPDAKGDLVALCLFASELRLRGTEEIRQPHVKDGNILCWNGEIFEGLNLATTENDGKVLFDRLCGISEPREFVDVLSQIEGPYALAFYHSASQRLFFARDPLGRRSLLIHHPREDHPHFVLVSASSGPSSSFTEFEELSTKFIYYLDLNSIDSSLLHDPLVFQSRLVELPRYLDSNSGPFSSLSTVNTALIDGPPLVNSLDEDCPELSLAVETFLQHLCDAIRMQIKDIARRGEKGQAQVAVLFSGGIDSTVIALLADRFVPEHEPIDLLNVAFENPRKIQTQKRESQNKKAAKDNITDNSVYNYLVPDRIAGIEELHELEKLCPRRKWNFVEVDVTFEEAVASRSIVENLMYPCRTVMDMSLAIALYFASRGIGTIRDPITGRSKEYTSPARVLLNGLGADELLGGYSRHRTTFAAGGWTSLLEELQLEIDRIPTRNLGRDDRVISSHGKETRHPFLSISLINYIVGLPVHVKTDPRLGSGIGDKLLLRKVALKEGLVLASQRKKRAMQFGSHSARMESNEVNKKGDNVWS